MKQSTHSNAATATQSKGKEKFILLLIGLVGAAGLVFVLNANSGKSAFSQQVSGTEKVELAVN
ncbi:MAG: hypothetical protein IPJ00_15830 [Saprospirales bacterium]|jgi:hypothetical protein|nr:hypothetical protein [Saprospirales bacterium]